MTSGKHKAPTTESTIAPAVKSAFWHMWLGVTAIAWIPLIIVGLIRKEPWHIVLAVLAILWLISTSKNLN